MKSFLFFLSFIISILSFAQENEIYGNGVFNFEQKTNQRIFTEDTRVRENPTSSSPILDSLKANTTITILQKDKNVTVLGQRFSHWYKIKYTKEGKQSEGYIWGGNIAMQYLSKNGFDFLFGLLPSRKEYSVEDQMDVLKNVASIKSYKNNEQIDEAIFESGMGESLSYSTFKEDSNQNLKNVDFILTAIVSGEACGVPSYEKQVLFSNSKLIQLPTLMNIGDADIFYHSETLIFPKDEGGKPNTIYFSMEEMEKDENEKQKFKRKNEEYHWDGKNLSQMIYLQ